ncbi:MAG: long-chain-fatty-acid--CoA ligase [Candidatus Rokuibacteriota bacterium]|nr:MAG: long-chain-fatty-acid--CoA ligase [Candidatus Rokubacteria bacterium]
MVESLVHRLEAGARRWPERRALVWEGGALTHAELDALAVAAAARLAARGVGPGARLALAIPNRWAFVVALLAGWKLGATVVPLDPRLTSEERRAILADLAPALMLEEADVAVDPPARREALRAPAPVDAPALILYTSGSTGRPKGAVIGHAALASANLSWAGPVMALTPEDVVLAALPLSHSFGLNGALLAPLSTGASVTLLERFSPEAALDAIRRDSVTVFPAVATMFRRILDGSGLWHSSVSSLRIAVSGAAPCPWELAEEWQSRTGVRILRGYGMTELFRPISYRASDPSESPAAVGRPVPGVEVRIVEGELWIKSPHAMQSYLNAPEETREVLTGDGWFRTGDLARIAADGSVEIVGRKRERILRAGYSIFPAEVETVLLTHPAVAEAAVIGVQHGELGEEVAAFVALKPRASARPEELVAYCRERLASFKYPRQVTILPELPKSATGKILKAGLPAARRAAGG